MKTTLKTCFKCQARKPLTEFYKHPQMGDGHVNKCKECNKLDVRKNRQAKSGYYREYDRNRGNRQPPEYQREYRDKNPERYKAHYAVTNAVRDGKIARSDCCEGCGSGFRIEGHHQDYSKPLDVVWLCSACHSFVHALERF